MITWKTSTWKLRNYQNNFFFISVLFFRVSVNFTNYILKVRFKLFTEMLQLILLILYIKTNTSRLFCHVYKLVFHKQMNRKS